VEIGAGFAAAAMTGSQHNDPLTPTGFASNHAGGILAGISNGDEIIVRMAVKPIPSITRQQQTIDRQGRPQTISIEGRHDISAIPRIVPVAAAMVKLTLADLILRHRASACGR
jgi:chorismate synthase